MGLEPTISSVLTATQPGELYIFCGTYIIELQIFHDIFVIGGDAKGTHIKEQFIDHEDGTKILVDVDFKFKGMMKISNLFGKDTIEDNYSKIFNDFLKII